MKLLDKLMFWKKEDIPQYVDMPIQCTIIAPETKKPVKKEKVQIQNANEVHVDKDAMHFIELCYPRVADQLKTLWGTSQCITYLNDIIFTDKNREGFNEQAFKILMNFKESHEDYFELKKRASGNINKYAVW